MKQLWALVVLILLLPSLAMATPVQPTYSHKDGQDGNVRLYLNGATGTTQSATFEIYMHRLELFDPED